MSMNNLLILSLKIIKTKFYFYLLLNDNRRKKGFYWFNNNTSSYLWCVNAIINDRLISFVLIYAIRNIRTTTLYMHMCDLVWNNFEATTSLKSKIT